ncbi:MAG: methyl-accepting chemotaxis protein, partial [Rhodospirillaceae bacterium]
AIVLGGFDQVEVMQDTMRAIQDRVIKRSEAAVVRLKQIYDQSRFEMLGLSGLGICFGLALSLFIAVVGMTRPVTRLTFAMSRLARGDLSAQIPGLNRGDEIGEMAGTVLVFKQAMIEQQQAQAERAARQEQELALSHKLKADSLGHLQGIVGIAVKSNDVFFGLAGLVNEIQHLAGETQAIAAAAEEMVSSVRCISDNSNSIEQKSQVAASASSDGISASGDAIEAMTRISRAMEEAVATVQTLSQTSSQISDMVGSIEGIAKQTNLLALNATIEAARAGESGKGFAVVAHEVKQLANQTARVTDDIRHRIKSLQDGMVKIINVINGSSVAVREGGTTMGHLGTRMREIKEITGEVTKCMAEISAVLCQQTSSSASIAETISQMAQRTEHNALTLKLVLDTMDGSVQIITERVEKFAVLGTDLAIAEMAKKDHGVFKNNIISAVLGRKKLEVKEIADHHKCRFGKWYDSVQNPRICSSAPYQGIAAPHERVHKHGRDAVQLAAEGKQAEALREVALMNEASREVLQCLDQICALLISLDSEQHKAAA